jgi:hypothetical protein
VPDAQKLDAVVSEGHALGMRPGKSGLRHDDRGSGGATLTSHIGEKAKPHSRLQAQAQARAQA